MSTITLGGKPFSIKDEIPVAGVPAPDFTFVKDDLSEGNLYDDYEGVVKVLIGIPSINTSVCQAESRRFNEELGKRSGVVGLVISMDLPFAQKKFCEAEGIENVITASDYRYKDFINEYNTEILSGPFKGLSARSVFVLDQKNNITYSELVVEVGDQPEYEKVLAAVDALL
ncbi:MAG: thiol peroxidase [Bacteroidota bacterium]